MAVEIESKGQLLEFLDVLKKRSWQVILPAAFVITVGVAVAVLIPKKYLVRTQVELRPVGVSVSSKEGGNASFQIRAKERIRKVVEQLGNTDYLALRPEERPQFILDMQEDVRVTLERGDSQGSTFVTLAYADVEPQWAVDFVRALREDWIQDVLERDRRKVDDERDRVRAEKVKLEAQVKQEEDELTDLKRTHNISATQPMFGSAAPRDEDPAFSRMQATELRLEQLQVEIEVAKVELNGLQTEYDLLPEKLTREQLVRGVDNETELKATELEITKLQQEIIGLKATHSRYKRAVNEIAKLEERRDALSRLVTKSERQTVDEPNPVRAALPPKIHQAQTKLDALLTEQRYLNQRYTEDQKEVRELQAVYQQISARSAQIDTLRDALKHTENRYQEKVQQAAILAGPLANPFEITEEVAPPTRPTEPNPWLIIAFSIAAGLGLGVGLAVLFEYTKSCFRSPADISRVMVVPVLGTINAIVTRREARLRAARRMAVGVSSAVFIASVAFVTWAWKNHPTLLSPGLRDTIEEMRSKFR